jgi:molybdate transport system substrate-binding protein
MRSRSAARATLLLAGAVSLPRVSVAQEASTLTVFAAASLTEPFTALGASFDGSHPGTKVRFNFAGSQQLVLQLQQGAKADVFASADERWMQTAQDSGLVEGEPSIFARNRLVVVVPRTNPAAINRLQDLARSGVKVVIAADAVPVGHYTRQMLAGLSAVPGFSKDYAARVLSNVVSYEDNVKGIVAKVQLGEADAGVVYRSDATGPSATQVTSIGIPDSANVIAQYPIALVHGGSEQELAQAFLQLVESAEGQARLEKAGFIRVGSATGATAP